MVDVVGGTVVGNESRGSVRVVVVEGKFAADGLRRVVGEQVLAGKRGIRALLEAHPAVSPQQDGVLHSSCRNDASPHCKGGRRGYSIGVHKLYAYTDGSGGGEGSRSAETAPRTGGGMSYARIRGRVGSL